MNSMPREYMKAISSGFSGVSVFFFALGGSLNNRKAEIIGIKKGMKRIAERTVAPPESAADIEGINKNSLSIFFCMMIHLTPPTRADN